MLSDKQHEERRSKSFHAQRSIVVDDSNLKLTKKNTYYQHGKKLPKRKLSMFLDMLKGIAKCLVRETLLHLLTECVK